MSLLKVTDLVVSYGGIEALKGISFEVEQGQIVTLIGANGAGKTTTMHAISGLIKAAEGTISLDGTELTKIPPHKIVGLGLAQVPEGRRVFAQQTVEENLILGAYLRRDQGEIAKDIQDVYQTFPRLGERRTQAAGTLSGGEQQMLAMGRALMAKPSILLLDEPSMGLSPLLVSEIFQIIEEINKKGTTILLVEQNAKRALSIANRAYVLETGRITLEGTGEGLARDERVRKAYLGG
jgi:branched-chain amino acid transport system ATP-binding protein